jgi:hypothetical protein
LGRGVDRVAGPRGTAGHRGEVDQVTAAVGGELIEEHLGRGDRAQQVGLDHPAVVVGELSGERAEQHHAGVVDQDVGAAEIVLDALGGGHDRAAVGDVSPDRDGAVAELVGQRLDAINAPGEQRDAMAVSHQRASGRLADARRGAGDDRDAVGAFVCAHYSFSLFTVVSGRGTSLNVVDRARALLMRSMIEAA